MSGFLSDSYVYLLRPDTTTVTLHSDSDDGLAWRGGDWALVHWLGDLKGKSLFTALDQSRNTGIANIAAAAGEPFANLFGDFSLALWTDSIPGIPRSAIPARNRFQSRNLRQIYQRLFDTNAQNPLVPRPYPGASHRADDSEPGQRHARSGRHGVLHARSHRHNGIRCHSLCNERRVDIQINRCIRR